MRGRSTTSSGMEVPAERRMGSPEAGCAGMVRSEAAARRVLRIGQHLEIHCAPKRGSLPDLAMIGTAGVSRPCLPRDHSTTGAAQSSQRICRAEVQGSRQPLSVLPRALIRVGSALRRQAHTPWFVQWTRRESRRERPLRSGRWRRSAMCSTIEEAGRSRTAGITRDGRKQIGVEQRGRRHLARIATGVPGKQ